LRQKSITCGFHDYIQRVSVFLLLMSSMLPGWGTWSHLIHHLFSIPLSPGRRVSIVYCSCCLG
jgi:hypothetical protein